MNDSRNPKSPSCAGAASKISVAAAASVDIPSGLRFRHGAASTIHAIAQARTALVAAPVIAVYAASAGATKWNHRVRGTPSACSNPASSIVTIPTCAPDIAKMCTVPVAAKSFLIASGRSSR